MKNWTVRQRITWSFGAVIALLIGMGVFAFARLATIAQETADLEKDSVPGLYYSNQIMIDWLDTFSLTQRHVVSTDRVEKQKVELFPVSGENVEALVRRIYATPMDVVEIGKQLSAGR